MVALRERKSRPRYSNVAEGFSDISGSVDGKDRNVDSASGSGSASGSEAYAEEGEGDGGEEGKGEEDELLSSADSSEFRPPAGDVQGERKEGGTPLFFADKDDDDEEEEEAEDLGGGIAEDLDQDMNGGAVGEGIDVDEVLDQKINLGGTAPDDRDEEKLVSINSQTARPARRKPQPANQRYIPSDLQLIPPAYRQIIKDSATRLTKPILARDQAERSKASEKYRLQTIDAYSHGPPTPFGTRLTAPPKQRGVNVVKWVMEDENYEKRKAKRQLRMYHAARLIPLKAPWEVWEGEGYWPEMWVGKGKGREGSGWILREEVRCGLDDVGRLRLVEVELLSEQ